ncbi:MAG: sigma-70 family RNA polymerase sigma factor [Pedobacter sp.]|nr:MAG: sigma-70 family RNA polymerase sigma factor [Pedobacter sp.]
MTKEEIEDILLVISDRSDNEKEAVEAFAALYRGYSKFLYSVVSASLKQRGIYDEHLADTVLNNTFFIVYEKPLSFSFPSDASGDQKFKAWLATVAKNELKRLLLEFYDNTVQMDVLASEPVDEGIPDDVFDSVNYKILDGALSALSERDRHILMTLYLYHEKDKNTPSNVYSMLCKMYNTTNANIRKIKERSEKKIVEYFSKYSQLTPLKHAK